MGEMLLGPLKKGDLSYIFMYVLVPCRMILLKVVRVSRKTCSTFQKNTYVFFENDNRLFKMLVSNYLCIHVICILIVWNSLINFLYLDIKIICLTATYTCRIFVVQEKQKV